MCNSRLDLHDGPDDGDVDVAPWRVWRLGCLVLHCLYLPRLHANTKGPARRPDDDGSVCGWW
jgi:hypothetical protein